MDLNQMSVQDLHLALIEHISFNDFDGKLVSQELRNNGDLWVGVISSHTPHAHPAHRLFSELPENAWFANILWIIAKNSKTADKLIRILKINCKADEVYAYTKEQAEIELKSKMIDNEVLIHAWWD